MSAQVDQFFESLTSWKAEMELLREVILECQFTETYKWMHPCYTFHNKNVVLIGGFKNYCALSFVKGSLLADSNQLLTAPGKNSTSGRQMRFTSVDQIQELRQEIRNYLFEAIEVEKSGVKVEYKKPSDLPFPEELEDAFKSSPSLKEAFNALTLGRQKGYLLHFNQAKQSKTKMDRIAKATARILDGKGLNDCVCGLSKRMPSCDGSHRNRVSV